MSGMLPIVLVCCAFLLFFFLPLFLFCFRPIESASVTLPWQEYFSKVLFVRQTEELSCVCLIKRDLLLAAQLQRRGRVQGLTARWGET